MNPIGFLIVGVCVVLMLFGFGFSLCLFYFVSSWYRIKTAELTHMPNGDNYAQSLYVRKRLKVDENEVPSY